MTRRRRLPTADRGRTRRRGRRGSSNRARSFLALSSSPPLRDPPSPSFSLDLARSFHRRDACRRRRAVVTAREEPT